MVTRPLEARAVTTSNALEELKITDEIVSSYSLDRWANHFSLMTAGYRDHIDPEDASNPAVPFNSVTVAIMAEAKARVLGRKPNVSKEVHIGGEVRAHTQTFIRIAARVYAAHGFRVHLRREVPTSPIWYSSFGVFHEEYQSGDNFTASHSPYFKLGWKVLDSEGKELTEEEQEIISEVHRIVEQRSVIRLAPWASSGQIAFDFDVDEPYCRYQESVLTHESLKTISASAASGFRCAAFPLGGSMGATSKRIFRWLGIPANAVSYFLDAEDPRFHRVGEIGNHNFGADVGKSEVCANTGAPEKLLGNETDLILLWDPDGDRLNVMSTAPSEFRHLAEEFGLKVGADDGKRLVVYLTPTQLYVILVQYRLDLLRNLGLLHKYDWFLGTTFPTSMALDEIVSQEGFPTIRVPVGFRNLGDLCRNIEQKLGKEQAITTLTGQKIRVGRHARALMLCEESGGATLGGPDLLRSKNGKRSLLALREKDGMQLALLAWAAAASLHKARTTLAERYCQIISERNIQYRYSKRLDISLYDERLTGGNLQLAKVEGMEKRDRAVTFFRAAATAWTGTSESGENVRRQLSKANLDAADRALSTIQHAAAVDGSMFEMMGARFVVRASGTDALIRYYLEATSRERLKALEEFIGGFKP